MSKSSEIRITDVVGQADRGVVEALVDAEQGVDFLGAVVEIEPEALLPRCHVYVGEVHCSAAQTH